MGPGGEGSTKDEPNNFEKRVKLALLSDLKADYKAEVIQIILCCHGHSHIEEWARASQQSLICMTSKDMWTFSREILTK